MIGIYSPEDAYDLVQSGEWSLEDFNYWLIEQYDKRHELEL